MSREPLTLLRREGCHLCDDALPVVRRAAGLTGRRVVVADVGAEEAFDRFRDRVPVVLDGRGRVVAEGEIRFWPTLVALVSGRRL